MSYKFDSLIAIMNKIDRREKVNIRSLMNDLEISERTTAPAPFTVKGYGKTGLSGVGKSEGTK